MLASILFVAAALCFWQAAKGLHHLGFFGHHTWRFSHTSLEPFVGINAPTHEWVSQAREVEHYECTARHCDAHKII